MGFNSILNDTNPYYWQITKDMSVGCLLDILNLENGAYLEISVITRSVFGGL